MEGRRRRERTYSCLRGLAQGHSVIGSWLQPSAFFYVLRTSVLDGSFCSWHHRQPTRGSGWVWALPGLPPLPSCSLSPAAFSSYEFHYFHVVCAFSFRFFILPVWPNLIYFKYIIWLLFFWPGLVWCTKWPSVAKQINCGRDIHWNSILGKWTSLMWYWKKQITTEFKQCDSISSKPKHWQHWTVFFYWWMCRW